MCSNVFVALFATTKVKIIFCFFFAENALVLLPVGFHVCRKYEFGNPYELDGDTTLRIKGRREKGTDVLFAT